VQTKRKEIFAAMKIKNIFVLIETVFDLQWKEEGYEYIFRYFQKILFGGIQRE
jgi:hypothetical protein